MRKWIVFFILSFIGVPAAMAAQGGDKAESACVQQFEQCSKQCDKQKTMWFFKGQAYQACVDKCVSQREACLASGKAKETQGPMDEGSKSAEPEKKVNDGAMDSGSEMDEERDQNRSQAKASMDDKTNVMDKESKQAKDMKDKAKEKMEKAKEKTDNSDNGGKAEDDDGGR